MKSQLLSFSCMCLHWPLLTPIFLHSSQTESPHHTLFCYAIHLPWMPFSLPHPCSAPKVSWILLHSFFPWRHSWFLLPPQTVWCPSCESLQLSTVPLKQQWPRWIEGWVSLSVSSSKMQAPGAGPRSVFHCIPRASTVPGLHVGNAHWIFIRRMNKLIFWHRNLFLPPTSSP